MQFCQARAIDARSHEPWCLPHALFTVTRATVSRSCAESSDGSAPCCKSKTSPPAACQVRRVNAKRVARHSRPEEAKPSCDPRWLLRLWWQLSSSVVWHICGRRPPRSSATSLRSRIVCPNRPRLPPRVDFGIRQPAAVNVLGAKVCRGTLERPGVQ